MKTAQNVETVEKEKERELYSNEYKRNNKNHSNSYTNNLIKNIQAKKLALLIMSTGKLYAIKAY